MAKNSFLDLQGLGTLVQKIKNFVEDNKVEVDDTLSSTSTNPVQNKVINDEISLMKTEYESIVWSGTQEEYDLAYANGEIQEGTLVNITDDYDENEITAIENSDILRLFEA